MSVSEIKAKIAAAEQKPPPPSGPKPKLTGVAALNAKFEGGAANAPANKVAEMLKKAQNPQTIDTGAKAGNVQKKNMRFENPNKGGNVADMLRKANAGPITTGAPTGSVAKTNMRYENPNPGGAGKVKEMLDRAQNPAPAITNSNVSSFKSKVESAKPVTITSSSSGSVAPEIGGGGVAAMKAKMAANAAEREQPVTSSSGISQPSRVNIPSFGGGGGGDEGYGGGGEEYGGGGEEQQYGGGEEQQYDQQQYDQQGDDQQQYDQQQYDDQQQQEGGGEEW